MWQRGGSRRSTVPGRDGIAVVQSRSHFTLFRFFGPEHPDTLGTIVSSLIARIIMAKGSVESMNASLTAMNPIPAAAAAAAASASAPRRCRGRAGAAAG